MTTTLKNTWLWGLLIILLVGFLYLVKGILFPFLAGLLVAYALSAAVQRLQLWGIPRAISAFIFIIAFLLGIGLFLFIAIPFVQTELSRLSTHIPHYGGKVIDALKPYLNNPSQYIEADDLERLRNIASSYIVDIITWSIKVIVGILTSGLALANLISILVITPLVAFYFLKDWNRMIAAIDGWLPRPYASKIRQIARDIDSTLASFVRGQIMVCLALGAYYIIVLSFIGLDFSIIVGSITGIIAFIPYVGAIVGFLLSFGIGLAQFHDWFPLLSIVGAFVVGQAIEGYFLVPYFVGDKIGLHPLWVIFSIFAGGIIFGFIGVLLALPVAAAIGVLLRYGLKTYKKSSFYLESSASKPPLRKKIASRA